MKGRGRGGGGGGYTTTTSPARSRPKFLAVRLGYQSTGSEHPGWCLRRSSGSTPIDNALDRGHSSLVKFMMERSTDGAPVLNTPKYCREMCYASAEGNVDLVARTLNNGLDPNASLYGGRTPLHIAARHGHLKVGLPASTPPPPPPPPPSDL